MIKKLLHLKEVPYFFTLLLGLVAYQFNNIVSIQFAAPTLSYRFNVLNSKKVSATIVHDTLECELENITNDKVFRNINIIIAFRTELSTPHKVYNPEIIPISPSTIVLDTLCENIADGEENDYTIPEIQPNARYILKLTTQHNQNIDEFPKLYFRSSDTVRLKVYDWELWFVKYQVYVNLFLLIVWLIIGLYYFRYLYKNPVKT